MPKRILLFLVSNILFITTISVICWVFGIERYATSQGIDYQALLLICVIYGFGASFLSLAFSRVMAKYLMGVKLINSAEDGNLQWLAVMVEDIAKRAGLPAMPQVGVYRSNDVNAFATGPTKSRALVAFSSALLQQMDREAIEGVAAHEIAHIKNGDMVTMTLLQGLVNAFVMFFARIVAYAASQAVKDELATIVWYVSVIVFQILFGLLGMLVTGWFSRRREFRADAGSAELVGAQAMIKGLERLKQIAANDDSREEMPETIAALGISNKKRSRIFAPLSTHPSLDDRIARLRQSGR